MIRRRAALLAGAFLLGGALCPGRAASKPPPAAPPVAAPREPVLVNLLEADFRGEPKLARLASALVGTFQILARRTPGGPDPARAASPPAAEGGRALFAQCTGSFLADGSAATAHHCIEPFRDDLAGKLVFRRHLFRIDSGSMTRTGYEDYLPTGRIIAQRGDLVMLELSARTPAPRQGRFPLPAPGYDYPIGQEYQTLGYRSSDYGVPSLARFCAIEDPVSGTRSTVINPTDYYVRCLVLDGMSGGPHFILPGGVQIGANSSMTSFSDGQFGTSTRITELRAP